MTNRAENFIDPIFLPYYERPYSLSVNLNEARENAKPVIEKFLRILEESGINANDALLIPDMLDQAILESNRYARDSARFVSFRKEDYDPRGYCEMFTSNGEVYRPYDSMGNPTGQKP